MISASLRNAFFYKEGDSRNTLLHDFTQKDVLQRSPSFTSEEWDLIIYDSHIEIANIEWIKTRWPLAIIAPCISAQSLFRNVQSTAILENKFPPTNLTPLEILKETTSNPSRQQLTTSRLKELQIKFQIVGNSPELQTTFLEANRIANCNSNVVIYGESGTGKELFARYIHGSGKREKGPFVAINCTALPEPLLESELFGHAKGSFTGATSNKIGLFEEADGGTLFLDEIGDMSLVLQAKLLRVLQERKIRRVGENQMRPVNVRVISATHKSLREEVKANRFREDLYYRLEVVPLKIPALRDRHGDIKVLAEHFLKIYNKKNETNIGPLSSEVIAYLEKRRWPGNVRELENCIERAAVMSQGRNIEIADVMEFQYGTDEIYESEIPKSNTESFSIDCPGRLPLLEDVIQKYLEFALAYNSGAKDLTARQVGIDRKTLYKRLTRHKEISKNG